MLQSVQLHQDNLHDLTSKPTAFPSSDTESDNSSFSFTSDEMNRLRPARRSSDPNRRTSTDRISRSTTSTRSTPRPESARRRGASQLTLSDCQALFHLPVEKAALELRVSRPTIARVMRANGIKRWPYRSYRAEQRRANSAGALCRVRVPSTAAARASSAPGLSASADASEREEEGLQIQLGGPTASNSALTINSPLQPVTAGKSLQYLSANRYPRRAVPSAAAGKEVRRSRPTRVVEHPEQKMEALKVKIESESVHSNVIQPVSKSSSHDQTGGSTSYRSTECEARNHVMQDAMHIDRASLRSVFGVPSWEDDFDGRNDVGDLFGGFTAESNQDLSEFFFEDTFQTAQEYLNNLLEPEDIIVGEQDGDEEFCGTEFLRS